MSLFSIHEASPSYWHQSIQPGELPAASALPQRTRFAVVGLGLAAAAVGWELANRGVPPEDIVLLDGARMAFGASGRNGGFVLSYPGPELLTWRHNLGVERWRHLVRLNIRNREWVRAFVEQHSLWHQPGGSYFAAYDEKESDEVARCHQLLHDEGLTDYELLASLPGPPCGFRNTIFQPADIGIHPIRYVAKLVTTSGVRIVERCAVAEDGFRAHAGGVDIETERGTLRAERLILATNAYTPLFFKSLGLSFPVKPARNQVLLAEFEGEKTNALWGDAIYYTREGFDYWRQFGDGRVLLGGGRDKDVAGEASWELSENRTVLDYLEGDLLPRLAAGRRVRVLHRWQGIMGFSPDDLPMAGELPGSDGRVFFAGGFSGYGLGLHRVVAEALVRGIMDGGDFDVFGGERLTRAG